MSAPLDAILHAEMQRWESRGLRRDLDAQSNPRVERRYEYASNDFLSLASHPKLIEAARDAIERFGAGGRAARLLGGGCELDRRAERAVSDWLGAEDALLFPSGYQANAGLISALARRGDVVFSDELNHASIIDAARLSRARVVVHRHVDLDHLAFELDLARAARRRVVVTESVFSMDGDAAPLLELHDLCARHDAFLVIDEAHAIGLLGRACAGGWSATDPDGAIARGSNARLAARLVTGGKALGVSGAFVVGSRALRDHLANRARSFVFTTAVSPAISGALCAAIEIASRSNESADRVLESARVLASSIDAPPPAAAIVPFVVGDDARALSLSRELLDGGLDVRAVRPPTVPAGTARLRIAVHAHNNEASVDTLIERLRAQPPPIRPRVEIRRRARALCVVGTDTDVGKTVVSALLARAASREGPAAYWKPVQTGDACDTREVARLAGDDVETIEPLYRFSLPASPHAAAAAAGSRIEFDLFSSTLSSLRATPERTLIVELAGGLLVPYDETSTQADWVARERFEVVLVARSGLGTLNHTLLTLEALAMRGRSPLALFLVGPRHSSNAATLRRRSGIARVFELERLAPLDSAALDAWLEHNDMRGLLP